MGKQEKVTDGIICEEKYNAAPIKIMWVLKEPYDPTGNGETWDFKKVINKKTSMAEFETSRPMYNRILYATWGILNNFKRWRDIPDAHQMESIDALKSIAYINVKKTLGNSSSNNADIAEAYKQNEDALHKQVEDCNPDIIIFCSTIQHFLHSINPTDTQLIKNGSAKYLPTEKRLYIDAYHPTMRGIPSYHLKESNDYSTQEMYVNDIIEIAEIWANKKRNNQTKH